MAMVRRGVMANLRDASCCMVEVVKGGAGLRILSVRLRERTKKVSPSVSATTASTSAADLRSVFFPFFPWYRAVKAAAFSPSFASSVQYSSGWKASIWRSRSSTMRVATDWTRPAERPLRTFFHSRGLSL